MGLCTSLLFVIFAFEWPTYYDGGLVDLGRVNDDFDDIIEIPPTKHLTPPPPKIQLPEIVEVDNEEELELQPDVDLDIEITIETIIEEVTPPKEEDVEEIVDIVEEGPQFPGGLQAFYKYVVDNMNYPSQARRMGIEGRVFVQFVVDEKGNLSEIKAIKGIGGGCDEEAVRVLKASPKFIPGKQRGRLVKVRMVLPFIFKLHK